MAERPKTGSGNLEKELDKVEKQLDAIDDSMKAIPVDQINNAPVREYEPQAKISNREANRMDALWLKPKRTIPCAVRFNEKYRNQYNYDKEPVKFIAQNNEIIGENIELWTKKYAGIPYEEWNVPTNRPVIGPRYLADQIASRKYNVITMREDKISGSDGTGTYYGTLQVSETRNRLDARPIGSSFVSMAG